MLIVRKFTLGVVLCVTMQGYAQNSKLQNVFDNWRDEIKTEFNDFRKECIDEYISFVRHPWKEFDKENPIPVPKEETLPPIIKEELKVVPKDDKERRNIPLIIGDTIAPLTIVPQPVPVQPIEEKPVKVEKYLEFTFFGTKAKVRYDDTFYLCIHKIDEKSVADALEILKNSSIDNTIIDCLDFREQRRLSDWAYLQMLKAMSEAVFGRKCNEAVLLMAYVYMQSGYKMRLANDGTKLYMMYASHHHIYDQAYYIIDGEYYYTLEDMPNHSRICMASFPKEQSLSLNINEAQLFDMDKSDVRTIKSKRDNDMCVNVSVNLNLLSFYSSYPTSTIGDNFCTRWAVYANTPMEENLKETLYPQIRKYIRGKSQLESVNIILHWIQTGFKYEYDNNVWGCDRAFFAEESLFYPYCDCEDRSILLTRIVRDILGLNCMLVYYPGHLAAAIEFTEGNPYGDYFTYEGHLYFIADATILGYGANVGETMRGMNNNKATVVVLK